MKVIWKYPLPINSTVHHVHMPAGAVIRAVGAQGVTPTVWAEVDPDAPRCPVVLQLVGTGHRDIAPNAEYVGTAHINELGLVLHVYHTNPEGNPNT